MSKINLLSVDTFSKIAAGEVVEKPSSVVKELVENSIDAKSKNITVEIINGGLDLIKIVDDGEGILNDDLEKAFMPHATSKIKEINDIFNINTLGFRGEALASISSVSKTLLKSKNETDEDAMEIYLEGGDVQYKKYSNQNKGTYIEVREMFYNVPARFKFLKSTQKEGSNINNIMSRLALSHPDIAFTYYNNDKLILKTYGTNNLQDVIRAVYNKKIYDNISYFEKDFDDYKIYGFIGNESISRGSRNQQSLFINKRFVTSKQLTIAVERAYQSFITVSKFPFFVLNIDLNPSKVDVNVHPQKAEVKFEDEKLMFKSVFDTIHASLRESYSHNLGFNNELDSLSNNNSFDLNSSISDDKSNNNNNYDFEKLQNEKILQTDLFSKEEKSIINHNFDTSDKIKSYGFESIDTNNNASYGDNSYKSHDYDGMKKEFDNKNFDNLEKVKVEIPIDLKNDSYMNHNSINDKNLKNKVNYVSKMLYNEKGDFETAKFPSPVIIGQYNKTYILAELNKTLYMFDQHACHEKINFELYMEDLTKNELVTQPLLIPHVIDLTMDDYSVFIDNKEVFYNAGFVIEEFGDRTIQVREVPYFLGRTNTESYFHEILDNLKNLGKGTQTEVKYMKIATVACKASIKASDELTINEMESLLNKLRFLKEPFTCPHGRPTMIKFTLTDIEKMFRRII